MREDRQPLTSAKRSSPIPQGEELKKSPLRPWWERGTGGEGLYNILALGTLLLAFALRVHLLGAQSLWNDEGSSYVQATRGFADIAAHAARDIHPPGYYWLLKIWLVFTGESEFALRAFSLLASVLSIAVTCALGKRLFSPLAGLAAALFITLNTFHITYAQEARMYSLLALWAVLGMWCLVGFLRSPHKIWALALALVNTAGLWTQYAYPFFMLAQGVIVLVWWIRAGFKFGPVHALPYYIGANLLSIALYLPWLPQALAQIMTWPNTGTAVSFPEALGMLVGWFSFGVTYRENDPSWIAIVLILLVFGLRARRGVGEWFHIALVMIWALLPVGLFLVFDLFREANLKLLLPAQIAFALWLGRGVWAVWTLEMPPRTGFAIVPRMAVVAAMIGITLNMWSGLRFLYHDADYQRDDYRGIVHDLTLDLRPDDAVILDAPNQEEVFQYYYDGTASVYPLPPGLGGDDAATLAQVEEIIDSHSQIFAVYWGETERDPNRVVEGTLTTNAYEVDSQWYGDVRLVRYTTPLKPAITAESGARFGDHITLERYALSSDTLHPGDVLQVRLDWRTNTPLDTRYKVFVQLLNPDGTLATQRDSEPGGGLALTTTWTPGEIVADQHALLIPNNLSPANYSLIVGLYNIDHPQARLPVNAGDYLLLGEITVGD